jgi:hypothetical protein
MKFIAMLVVLFAGSASASSCEISGVAELWSYDSCLWRYETDDTIHPEVLKCVERNRSVIEKRGSCKAKRIFKERICRLVVVQGNSGTETMEGCMSKDKPLGPSVEEGGI